MKPILAERNYISITELASHWGVSYHAVYRDVHRGRIPYIRAGHLIRIPVEFVEQKQAEYLIAPGYEEHIVLGEE